MSICTPKRRRKIIQKEYKENPRYKYYDFAVKMIRVDKEPSPLVRQPSRQYLQQVVCFSMAEEENKNINVLVVCYSSCHISGLTYKS